MTAAGESPHIVQRPHNLFTSLAERFEVVQGQEPLIPPVQVNYIGLLNERVPAYIGAEIG